MSEGAEEARVSTDPDVYLDVPEVKVDEITLDVQDLRARVSLQAEVLDLLKLNVGADVFLGSVNLTIKGVEAQALLKVRLDNVARIIDRVLQTIDTNPQLLEHLTRGVGRAVEDIGLGAGHAVRDVGAGAGGAVRDVGAGAGGAVRDVGAGAGGAVRDVGTGAGRAVRDVGASAGDTVRDATGAVREVAPSGGAGTPHEQEEHHAEAGTPTGPGRGDQRHGEGEGAALPRPAQGGGARACRAGWRVLLGQRPDEPA
ncbi:hypothetical protein AB0K18_34930 [Nonomuraea sp. NPDC049421]|uniref:hypothetical protein n=1 Tax=Nonomuraea sp. NPDC049421 TaxID=3155275 RepID=UPI00342C106B